MVPRPQSVHYAITDLHAALSGPVASSQARVDRLRSDLARWIAQGVDVVQLREKALSAGEVLELAQAAMDTLRQSPVPQRPRLLVNSRADIAIAARADGVHLTSNPGELRPEQVRRLYQQAGLPAPFVSKSCHEPAEVVRARDQGADLVLFGPVFGKSVAGEVVVAGGGLPFLAEACGLAAPLPVLALGGVRWAEERACLAAGAAGVAGIRSFAG